MCSAILAAKMQILNMLAPYAGVNILNGKTDMDTSESVPWRDAYPEYSEAQLIGKALAGARARVYASIWPDVSSTTIN